MDKIIKAILLKDNTVILSAIEEVEADIGEPNCKLINPYKLSKQITGEYILETWLDFTLQNEIMICSDSILTITNPKPTLLEKYLELTTQ